MNIRGLILLWWFTPQSAFASGNIVDAKFNRKGVGKVTNIIASTRPRSKIACSVDCVSTTGCASFTFNETACYLLADEDGEFDMEKDSEQQDQTTYITTTTTVLPTTAAICASSSGYELRTLAGKNYLLRFGDSPVIADIARMCCEDDGAHLITIESQAMLDDVAALLTTLGHDKYKMWIDGRDIYGDDVMYSWTGSVLPFIAWSAGNPDGGPEDCMAVLYSNTYSMYRLSDTGCANDERVFMCQK